MLLQPVAPANRSAEAARVAVRPDIVRRVIFMMVWDSGLPGKIKKKAGRR